MRYFLTFLVLASCILVTRIAWSQATCDDLPTVFDCRLRINTGLEGTACPKGDIPYVSFFANCQSLEGEEITLLGGGDEAWGYEYSPPANGLCPSLPIFFGPSSVGIVDDGGPGCPLPGVNCSAGLAGSFASKWCYRYRHYVDEGTTCSVHVDNIAMGTVDFVGQGSSAGTVDAAELAALSVLLGTRCDFYVGSGAKYNPVVDFNKDGFIDASDLALLAQHFGHNCSQWAPTIPKTTNDIYPYAVFDLPEMQVAMIRAGVDREFIESIWIQNGAEQRLFYKADRYNRAEHMAQIRSEKSLVDLRSWSQLRVLYR